MNDFASRVIDGARRFGPLCVGIDPHPGRVPALFGGDTARGAEAWGLALIDLCKDKVCAIKPQVGLFERFGPEGFVALQAIARAGREAGLVVLMDAKRGDIGSTAEGYASAWLAPDAPFPCDAVTVNPYLGLDTLEPFLRRAREGGKGVVVLARTSNPGAADFQTRAMGEAPLYLRVVDALGPMIEAHRSDCGWSNIMLVTGATGPAEARQIRLASPYALFLVPGYGAQGAGAADAVAGFVRGEGGLVSASRSVTFPPAADGTDRAGEWRSAVTGALADAQNDLRQALNR